jgi:O-antigen/teichoic acid export membrane protein
MDSNKNTNKIMPEQGNTNTDNKQTVNDQSDKTHNYVKNSLFNTSLTIAASLVTKVLNLVFNVLIARIISKEAYGIAKVYLEFAFLLLMYFPRETIRKTAQKYCPDSDENKEKQKYEQSAQLSWFLSILFALISIPVYFSFIFFAGDNLSEVKLHLFIYVLVANVELIAEPVIIYMNIKIDNSNKIIAQTVANYTRIISNYLFALLFGFDLWSFTLSRLLASSTYVSYILYVGITKFKLDYKV